MIKILVIDDVQDNRLKAETTLEQHFEDCKVISIDSGPGGVELAIKEKPELILLNIDISGMGGMDVCQVLKGNPSTSMTPIIFLVDLESDLDCYVKGLSLGADAFIRKPISKEELIAQVKVALRLKRSEDILRRNRHNISEELAGTPNVYEELFNSVVNALFVCSMKGKILDVNRKGSEYFGLPRGAILNLKLFDYIEGDEIEQLIKSDDIDILRVETNFLLPTGSFPVEINGSQIEYNGRTVLMMVITDISARKAAEQSRNVELNFLERLVNSFSSTIIVVDESGVISCCNASGEAFLGRPDGPVVGERLVDLSADFELYLKLFRNREAAERVLYLHSQSFQLSHLANSSFDISIFSFETVVDKSYTVFKIDDISNNKELEEFSVQEQMMKSYSHFSRGLAHDLNNILTGINTVVSLIRLDMEREGDVDLNEYLGTIEISGRRATDIVKQLRSIARRDRLALERIELNMCIGNVVKICRNSFDDTVDIKVDFRVDNPLVEAELTGIEQVILNICMNSAHAMTIMRDEGERQGGLITIKTSRFYADRYYCLNHPGVEEREYIKVSISDTGVGLDSDSIHKVFEPLFSTKDKGQGRGLGLSVAYNIIKQHSGFIELESKRGEGTVVNVYFPEYTGGSGKSSKKAGAEPLATGEGGVLVLDSEELVRKLACSILKKCGYSVFSTDNMVEGLELLEREKEFIRLVLLDISMPALADDEILGKIKGVSRDMKVVITSGFVRDDRINSYMEQGCDAFLEKPFNVRQLSNIVKETLEKD